MDIFLFVTKETFSKLINIGNDHYLPNYHYNAQTENAAVQNCSSSVKLYVKSIKMNERQYNFLMKALDDLLILLSDGAPLTEERIYKLCDECLQNRAEEPLSKALSKAFSRPSILARCFASKISENANETSKDTGNLFAYVSVYLNFYLFTV